jgi:hypothetical protein
MAKRQGLQLHKSRRSGEYHLVERNRNIHAATLHSLDQVEDWLHIETSAPLEVGS